MERVSRWIYLAAAWLFVLGVVVQVFLAGLVVVAQKSTWEGHVGLGHTLAGPLLLMVVSMFTGRMPGQIKWLTALLFLNYALQADVLIFLRVEAPVLSALHPVLALTDFALGLALARRALPLAKQAPARAVPQPG